MKINVVQSLKNMDGVAINSTKECVILASNGVDLVKNAKGEEVITIIDQKDKSLTLKKVCVDSLLLNTQDDTSGDEKAERYMLAMKIHEAKKEVDLESKDIVIIKELIGKNYGPLVVGQAHLMLEGKTK